MQKYEAERSWPVLRAPVRRRTNPRWSEGTSTSDHTAISPPDYSERVAGSQLKRLLRAHRDRDDLAFRRAALEIIDEEEAKKHTQLARELRRLLVGAGTSSYGEPTAMAPPPMDRDGDVPLASVGWSQRSLSTLTLPPSLDQKLRGLLDEVAHWEDLDRAGVPRRQRVLLHGPPGCGKTSVAASMAWELGVPLATVRVDSIVSSYLGETGSNLRRVFDYAAHERVVLLFDEFDAVGKERDDPSDHGELRRVVNAVLQMMEDYVGPSLLVAATNHPGRLDAAVWRRFDEILDVPVPTVPQLRRVMSRILMGHTDDSVDLRATAEGLKGLPHAAAEKAAFDARRCALVEGRDVVRSSDVERAVADVKSRRWI